MKTLLKLAAIIYSFSLAAQQNYTDQTQQALETMWKAKDTTGLRKAFTMYEAAFAQHPDSIEEIGLYKASVLAGELKEYDKAFKYLTTLSDMNNDDVQGWEYFTGQYADKEYANLITQPRWIKLKEKAQKQKTIFFDRLEKEQVEFFNNSIAYPADDIQPQLLYARLKKSKTYTAREKQNYSVTFKVNDTLSTSYFVHLPRHYNPAIKYPLLVFLHGAVRQNGFSEFQGKWVLEGWNRFYTKYADENNVILVFPQGSAKYNWMVPDDGFYMVPQIIRDIKKAVNADDNKIFVSGHSNGATGSFSYLIKDPTLFAGFYGFNTYPKVFTGGTFIKNAASRSFINFSTDQDYYYPPVANDSLSKLAKTLNLDYKDHRFNGYPHWFPKFDASEKAYVILFNDIKQRKRNPFPVKIYRELDNDKYGRADWLHITAIDTTQQVQQWHTRNNFKIIEWLVYDENDSLRVMKVDKPAFDFPRKSGVAEATYTNNTFTVKTSCIKSLRLYISPEMINMKRKVKVIINGKTLYNKKANYNKQFMQQNFESELDSEQLWVSYLEFEL